LEQLLENIPSMFQGTTIADSALGAAIKVRSVEILWHAYIKNPEFLFGETPPES
jgi:hypothetical protein